MGKENKNKKKKKIRHSNKSVSPSQKDLIRSNKRYYCSGFNLYKEIISNKKRNASVK